MKTQHKSLHIILLYIFNNQLKYFTKHDFLFRGDPCRKSFAERTMQGGRKLSLSRSFDAFRRGFLDSLSYFWLMLVFYCTMLWHYRIYEHSRQYSSSIWRKMGFPLLLRRSEIPSKHNPFIFFYFPAVQILVLLSQIRFK